MNRNIILTALIAISMVFTAMASMGKKTFPFANYSYKEIQNRMGKEDLLFKEADTTILIYKKLDKTSAVFCLINDKCKSGLKVSTRLFDLLTTKELLKNAPTREVFEASRFIRHVGLHKKGVEILETYNKQNPDSSFSYVYFAETLIWEGQIERGLAVMEEAIKVAKPGRQYEIQRMNQISILIKAKQYERAIEESLILLKEPEIYDKYDVNYNLACAYSLVNKPKEAIACLEIAASDPETDPQKYQGRKLLEIDTDFDNIRHLPEFKEVKMKFKF